MASIRKRGNSYQITVSNGYDVNGKKIIETATFTPDLTLTPKRKQEALDKFVFEFEQKVKNGKLLKGEKLTLNEYTDYWIKEYAKKNLEITTLSSYEQLINSKILPALGHLKLAQIKPLHLQSFYSNLTESGIREDKKDTGYSKATIKRIHAVLSSLFSTAVQWQLIESNPCERVKLPKEREKSKEIKHFTLEQAETFLEALDMDIVSTYTGHDRIDDTGKIYHVRNYQECRSLPLQFKVFFNIAMFGGLRKSEVLGLTWNDIDFEHNTITINKGTVYVNRTVLTKNTKNESSERTISLPKSVMNLIKQLRTEQKEYRLSLGDQWIGNNDLFIQWSGKKMHPSTPYHTFKKVINNYNKSVVKDEDKLPDIPLHGLRHTAATLLIAEHVDVRTVSNRLGHAQTSTTLNIYAAALKKSDEEASDALENLFNKNAK